MADLIQLTSSTDNIPNCVELTGSLAGVRLPRSVRVFDCREHGQNEFKTPSIKAHYGETLWGSERAAYKMGLKLDWTHYFDDFISGTQCYQDLRKLSPADTKDLVRKIRARVAGALRDYRKAKRNQAAPGEGGGCRSLPVMVGISNYGWSLVGDKRTTVVEAFKPYNSRR